MKEKETLDVLHRIKFLTKYGLTAFALLLTLHCLLLALGINVAVVHIIMVLFALVLGLHLSKLFNLCCIHRCSVVYICAVLLCVALRPFGVFGEYLTEFRIVMFSIGAIHFINLIIWTKVKNC